MTIPKDSFDMWILDQKDFEGLYTHRFYKNGAEYTISSLVPWDKCNPYIQEEMIRGATVYFETGGAYYYE